MTNEFQANIWLILEVYKWPYSRNPKLATKDQGKLTNELQHSLFQLRMTLLVNKIRVLDSTIKH